MVGRKKIVFIIPSMGGGGAERILADVLASLDSNLYEPILVVFAKKGKTPTGIRVYDLEKRNAFDFVKLILRLRSVLIREQPSLAVSFITYANYISLLSKQFIGNKIPFVIAEHSVVYKTIAGRFAFLKSLLVSRFYPLADRVITASDGCKRELVQLFHVPDGLITVIRNGVNIDLITQLAKEEVEFPWFKEETPVIISVGRLTKAKNFPLLLKAVSLIKPAIDWRLLIIGDGEERAKLLALTNALGLSDKVIFLGYQDNPYKYLSRARLLVVSSDWESFSLVILEAMCLGVTVVATDCPFGPAEIIEQNKNGILVPPSNAGELGGAISRVLIDADLCGSLVKAAQSRVSDFELTEMNEGYQKIFKELVNSHDAHENNSN